MYLALDIVVKMYVGLCMRILPLQSEFDQENQVRYCHAVECNTALPKSQQNALHNLHIESNTQFNLKH